jgi:hypothetical protein
MSQKSQAPDATLFIATGCVHCPAVLAALCDLVKQGLIGHLEVTNIVQRPDKAAEWGIRATPWTRIGPFTLPGSHTPGELRQWAERAGSARGMRDYLAELIENQRLDEAVDLARRDPGLLRLAVDMLGDLQTPMGVRIGIGALIEELAGDPEALVPALEPLHALLASPEAPVRADAAYYLGLSHDPRTREWLTPLLNDADPQVREIVAESLAGLGEV